MRIAYYLFEEAHGKKDQASSRMRGHWMVKYWPEAEIYKRGKPYDVVIFQKVYFPEFAEKFKGIKILDVCDPDWFNPATRVIEMINVVDALTCPSEIMAKALKNFTDKPIKVIPDRQDLEYCKEKKQQHRKGRAKNIVWYGYSHNANIIRPFAALIKKLDLKITFISNEFTSLSNITKKDYRKNEAWKLWKVDKVNREIIKNDIVFLPAYSLEDKKYKYKSNNKNSLAMALGMPVATTRAELVKLMEYDARIKASEEGLKEVLKNYNIKQSIKEMKEFINDNKALSDN